MGLVRACAAALLPIALLGGCARGTSTGADDARGTLRIVVEHDVKTLNPILASNTVDGFVQRFMFEPLLSADARGNPVPILAAAVPTRANGGVSRDGRTITYRLRANARWSDGVPVTARDVRFSWRAIMSPANNAVSRHVYDDVERIDVPDDRTAVVHLKAPFAPFVDSFFAESDQPYSIVPAHVLERYADINRVPFNARPEVTDGPFRLERWDRGDRIVLTANDAFFLGKPGLRRIEIRTVTDENTSITLLRTHAADYMYEASIATYPQLARVPGIRFAWVNVNGFEGMGFNLQRKPLGDPRVRSAIALAIDKPRLVRTLTFGRERAATGDLPDWMWAADPRLPPQPYDPARARALLREAGVALPLSLVLVAEASDVTRKREAVQLQAMLREIGIELEVKTFPGDVLYAPAGAGGIVMGGKFDLALWPWYGGIDPDDSAMYACANMPPHGYNVMRYCSSDMERLQARALAAGDRAVRATAYRAIEALATRDKPLLIFWWQRQQEAFSVDLKGFAPNPVVESWNAWEWKL